MTGIICPSYRGGFASPQRGRLKYPTLWRGCVGAWSPLLGPSGTTLRDNSGFGNHGTLTDMESSDWAVDGGKYALDFGGTDECIKIPDFQYGNNQVSVCCWMRRSGALSNVAMMSHYQSTTNNRSWSLQLANIAWTAAGTPGGDELAVIISQDGIFGTAYKVYWADVNICDDVWNHVGFTFGASTLKLFVNGLERSTNKDKDFAVTAVINPPVSLSFGAVNPDSTPANLFIGRLDDFRMYERVLTPSDFKLLATRRGIAYETPKRRSSRSFFYPRYSIFTGNDLQLIGAS